MLKAIVKSFSAEDAEAAEVGRGGRPRRKAAGEDAPDTAGRQRYNFETEAWTIAGTQLTLSEPFLPTVLARAVKSFFTR
jgi:hypothetical protein